MAKEVKKPRGRPEVSDKERRSVLLQFRVTENDAAYIKRMAAKTDLSVSDWLRKRIASD